MKKLAPFPCKTDIYRCWQLFLSWSESIWLLPFPMGKVFVLHKTYFSSVILVKCFRNCQRKAKTGACRPKIAKNPPLQAIKNVCKWLRVCFFNENIVKFAIVLCRFLLYRNCAPAGSILEYIRESWNIVHRVIICLAWHILMQFLFNISKYAFHSSE